MDKIPYTEIDTFCEKHIPHYEERVSLALDKIGEWRCPLYMADSSLYDEMVDAIAEWCDENEISYESDLSDIDPEEVIFNA